MKRDFPSKPKRSRHFLARLWVGIVISTFIFLTINVPVTGAETHMFWTPRAIFYNQKETLMSPTDEINGINGEYFEGAGIALGDIDRNGILDMLCFALDINDPEIRGIIGWNIDKNGDVSGWTNPHFDCDAWGTEYDGGGVALYDVDQNGTLDALFFYLDIGNTSEIRYNIGWDLTTNGMVSRWTQHYDWDLDGTLFQGAGVGIGNIDGDSDPDVIFFGLDTGDTSEIRYKIGWDMDTSGHISSWSSTKGYVDLDGTDFDGGGGLALADLNGNGKLDALFMGLDLDDTCRYVIGWDINSSGDFSSWSNTLGYHELEGDTWDGAGVAVGDVSGDGILDAVFMGLDADDSFRYRVVRSFSFGIQEWTYNSDLTKSEGGWEGGTKSWYYLDPEGRCGPCDSPNTYLKWTADGLVEFRAIDETINDSGVVSYFKQERQALNLGLLRSLVYEITISDSSTNFLIPPDWNGIAFPAHIQDKGNPGADALYLEMYMEGQGANNLWGHEFFKEQGSPHYMVKIQSFRERCVRIDNPDGSTTFVIDVLAFAKRGASHYGYDVNDLELWMVEAFAEAGDLGATPLVLPEARFNLREFKVTFSGPPRDIVQDGKVDIKDVCRVAMAFGSSPGNPRWDPLCDVNDDGKVDMVDITRVAIHFGEVYWQS